MVIIKLGFCFPVCALINSDCHKRKIVYSIFWQKSMGSGILRVHVCTYHVDIIVHCHLAVSQNLSVIYLKHYSCPWLQKFPLFNPFAVRRAKTRWSFGWCE